MLERRPWKTDCLSALKILYQEDSSQEGKLSAVCIEILSLSLVSLIQLSLLLCCVVPLLPGLLHSIFLSILFTLALLWPIFSITALAVLSCSLSVLFFFSFYFHFVIYFLLLFCRSSLMMCLINLLSRIVGVSGSAGLLGMDLCETRTPHISERSPKLWI